MNRRRFTINAAVAGAAGFLPALTGKPDKVSVPGSPMAGSKNVRLSLNAYSFDRLLRSGSMKIAELLQFCSDTGFDAVALTGYYFPGYPSVPPDDIIYDAKKRAFGLGLSINNTGVRNDFSWADPLKRDGEKRHIKEWIVVAQKLGAPSLRIFSGTLPKDDITRDKRAGWIADDIRECAEFGREHGVMLAIQNHNDFIRNAPEVEKLLKMIGHDWVGLMLDIGSYHTQDPYKDIESNSKYAISWQMKEKVYFNDLQTDTDYPKIIDIVRRCGYKGCLPLETLGEGDPYQKVRSLFNKVSAILHG